MHRTWLFLGLCSVVLFCLAPQDIYGQKRANGHYTGQEIQRAFEIMNTRCGEQLDAKNPGCRVLRQVLEYVRYGEILTLSNDPVDVLTGEYLKAYGKGSEYLTLPENEKQRFAAALYHVALLHVLARMDQTGDAYSMEMVREPHTEVISAEVVSTRNRNTAAVSTEVVRLRNTEASSAEAASPRRAAATVSHDPSLNPSLAILDDSSDRVWRFGSSFSAVHLMDAFIPGGEVSLAHIRGPIWYEAGLSAHQSKISYLRLEAGPWWRFAQNYYVALRAGIGAYYDGRDTPQKMRIGPIVGAGAGVAVTGKLELWLEGRMPENRRRTDEWFPDIIGSIGLRWHVY